MRTFSPMLWHIFFGWLDHQDFFSEKAARQWQQEKQLDSVMVGPNGRIIDPGDSAIPSNLSDSSKENNNGTTEQIIQKINESMFV